MRKEQPALPGLVVERDIPSKVVGTSFWRPDFALLRAGDEVFLSRERDNPVDPNAILCTHYRAGKLGYVPAKNGQAGEVGPLMDAGAEVTATIKEITGGGDRDNGINITIYVRARLNPARFAAPPPAGGRDGTR